MLLINSKFPGWLRYDQSKVILFWFTSTIYGTHPGYFYRESFIPRLTSSSSGRANCFLRIQCWHSTEMSNNVNQGVYIMKLHSFTLINRHDEHCIVIALALTKPVEIWIFSGNHRFRPNQIVRFVSGLTDDGLLEENRAMSRCLRRSLPLPMSCLSLSCSPPSSFCRNSSPWQTDLFKNIFREKLRWLFQATKTN